VPFFDSFEHPISYLRISVTDQCNSLPRCLSRPPLSLRRRSQSLPILE